MSVKPCKFYDIRSGSPVLIGDYEAALEWLVANPDVMANPFISKVRKSFQSALDKLGLKANVEFISDKEAEGIVGDSRNKFQIIGEKAYLEQAEKDNLDTAKKMESDGKDSKTIFLATGWEKGTDKKWKYEFGYNWVRKVRNNYEQVLPLLKKGTTLGEIFALDIFGNTPSFIKAYPELANVELKENSNIEGMSFNPEKNRISIGSDIISDRDFAVNLAHEVQHAIQGIEGFARGGDPSMAFDDLFLYKERLKDLYGKDSKIYKEAVADLDENEKGITAFEIYRRLAGEVEARNTAARAQLTPEQRRSTPMSETEDLDRKKQVVLFMRNAQGTILGFVQPQPDGSYKVWIDPATTDAETPIHELAGHIFMPLLKEAAPELHARGIELIQNTPYLKAAEALGLEGDAASEEALAQAIGEKGKQLSETKRPKFMEWLNGMWQKVGEKLGISVPIKNLTLGEFTDLIAGSVLEGDKLKVSEAKPATKEAKSPTAKADLSSFASYVKSVGLDKSPYSFLFDLADKLGVKLDVLVNYERRSPYTIASYDSKTKTVYVPDSLPSNGEEVLAHEIIHAIINNKLGDHYSEKNVAFRNALIKIGNEASQYMVGRKVTDEFLAIVKNPEEMATYGLTRPDFARFLNSIPVEGVKNESKTLWGKLKDIILGIIGGEKVLTKTQLDALNDVLDGFLEITTSTEKKQPEKPKQEGPTAKNYVEARDQIAEGAELTKEEVEEELPYFLSQMGLGPLNEKTKNNKAKELFEGLVNLSQEELLDTDSSIAPKIAKWVESVQSESGIKPMSLADRIKAYTAAQRNELKGTATSGGVLYKALLDAIDLAVDAAVKGKTTAKEINAAIKEAIKKAIEDFRTQYQTNQKADAEKAIAYLQKGAPTSVKKQIEGKNEPTKRQVQKAIDRAFAVGMGYGKQAGFQKGATEGGRAGFVTGREEGKKEGFQKGATEGMKAGFVAGREVGFEVGMERGTTQGQKAGFKQGTADARTQIKNTISEALDNLETKLSSKQVQQILNAIPKIFTEATKEKFSNTVNNIIDDANYVDRVSKIAAKQAKAKGRDYGNQTNLVKNFLTLNPNAIPEKLLSDYEQALDGLIQKGVPAIKVMNAVYNDIMDAYDPKVVSRDELDHLVAKVASFEDNKRSVKNIVEKAAAIDEEGKSNYESERDQSDTFEKTLEKDINAYLSNGQSAIDGYSKKSQEYIRGVAARTSNTKIKTLEDYLEFSKALTSFGTTLDRLVAQGEITEKDANNLRETYNKAEIALRNGTTLNIKEEVGRLKERMIADAKQLTADVRLSGFTPLQKEVANKLMNIPLETLMDFTPQQLNLYQKAIIELDNGFINTTAYDLIKQAGLIDAAKRISEATKAVMDQKKINDQKNIIAKTINSINGFAWKSVNKGKAQLLLRSKEYWDELFGTGLDKPVWNKILAPLNNAIDQALHQTKVVSSDYYAKTRNLSDIQKTKLSLILIQQDYENNPVVIEGQSIDHKDLPVNEKDKYKYITQNLDKYAKVSDKEKALVKKAYAKLPKDADGNLDTKKAIAALSPSEKAALEAIKGKIFDKLKDYVRINTEKRGDVFESRNEYTPNNVRQESVVEDVSNAEFINEVLGTTASNAIRLKQAATNQRTGDRFYVSYDLDNIVLGHIRDTFRDFFLTDPVRTTLGAMTRLAAKSEANSDQQGMLMAMKEAIKESVITALDLNRESSDIFSKAIDKSLQRIRVLSLSTPRFISDFISNMGRLAIENPQAYQRAVDVLIDKDNKYDKMMEQLFTAVSDFSSLHGGESITNAKGPIEKFTEKMIGLGDAGPMKVSAVTEFEKAFKKETGKDFNLDQFLNEDSEYADENAKAIIKARDKAQAELYRQFVPQSAFAQAASTKLVPFLYSENQIISKKIPLAKVFSFLQNYTVRESLKAGQALKDIALGTNEGRVMAARRLTSVIVSNTMYAVGMSMLAQAYKEIGDDDEEPWDEEVKNVLSAWTDDLGAMMAGNATSLLMGRYGSVMRTILPIIMGLVKVAGKDSEAEAYIDGLYKYMQEGLYTSAITTRDTGKKWLKLIPAIGKVAADIGEGELAVAQLYNDYLNNNESKAKDIIQAYQLLITAFTLMVPNPVLPTFDKWIRGQKAKQFESEEKEKETKKQIEAKLNPNKDVKKAFNEALESGNIEKAKKAFNKMTEKMPEGRVQGELADKFTEIRDQNPIQNHSDEVASVVYGLMDDATIIQGDTVTTVRKLYSESELAFFKKKMDDFSKKQAKKVEVLDSIRGGSFFTEYFMPYNKKFGGELTETPVVKKEPSLTERTMKNLKMLFK